MEALLLALVGLFGSGFLGQLLALASGKLVPSSRVKDKDAEIERQNSTIGTLRSAVKQFEDSAAAQQRLNERNELVAEVTESVLRGMDRTLGKTGSG